MLLAVPAVCAAQASLRHAAHSGQHGGILLPIANDTLHVEGVWQEQRRFRVYVTDAAGDALVPARLRELQMQVADDADRVATLAVSADGEYLEARIATQPVPAVLTIVVKSGNTESERLAMRFSGYSSEPSFEVKPIAIPGSLTGVLEALRAQVGSSIELVAAGAFGQVYEPATHSRELLLALVPYAEKLDPAPRRAANAAIAEMLRASWLVHLSGDVGTPMQSSSAVKVLRDAFNELSRAFPDLVTPIS
jgi:hypothetical protein